MCCFFIAPASSESYTLSLHDALPILVVTGMGKSRLIGQKISATFSSTGTPSFFLHPAEALHGDLVSLVRSEEHTSELQSLTKLVCRLLLGKKQPKPKENLLVIRFHDE